MRLARGKCQASNAPSKPPTASMITIASEVCRPWKRNFPAANATANMALNSVAGTGETSRRREKTMRNPTGMNDNRSRGEVCPVPGVGREGDYVVRKIEVAPRDRQRARADIIHGVAGCGHLCDTDLALPRTAAMDLVAKRDLAGPHTFAVTGGSCCAIRVAPSTTTRKSPW